jgi:hypothetical protein
MVPECIQVYPPCESGWSSRYSDYATDWTSEEPCFDSRLVQEIYLLSKATRPVLGPTQPLIQRTAGALSQGVKLPGRKGDHSPPSSAEVKNEWSYNFTYPYAFMACTCTNLTTMLHPK